MSFSIRKNVKKTRTRNSKGKKKATKAKTCALRGACGVHCVPCAVPVERRHGRTAPETAFVSVASRYKVKYNTTHDTRHSTHESRQSTRRSPLRRAARRSTHDGRWRRRRATARRTAPRRAATTPPSTYLHPLHIRSTTSSYIQAASKLRLYSIGIAHYQRTDRTRTRMLAGIIPTRMHPQFYRPAQHASLAAPRNQSRIRPVHP